MPSPLPQLTPRSAFAWRHAGAYVPVAFMFAALLAFQVIDTTASFESWKVLFAGGLLFTTVASVMVAVIIGRTFLLTGARGLLFLTTGVIIWGLAAPLGPVIYGDNEDAIIASHNLLACFAGMCHLLGVSAWGSTQPKFRRPGEALLMSLLIALGVVALTLVAVGFGLTPQFFVQGQGGTGVRYFVLATASAVYLATGALLWRDQHRTHSVFRFWYSLAMFLIGFGLLGVMFQSVHGGWAGWTARASQWLAGIYMIVAAVVSARESGGLRLSMSETIARNERQLSEQARLLNMTADAIFIRDADDRIVYWNRGAFDTYGYSASEALGRSPHGLLKTRFSQPREEIEAELKRTGHWQGELTHVRKDGSTVTDLSRWVLDRSPVSGAATILESNTNIADRKLAEDAHAHLAAVVQSSDDAIITKTLDGVITTWNPAAERMFGYTAVEAVGQPVLMLFPEDRRAEEPAILARLRNGERIEHYETVRRRKDGRLIDVSLTTSPIRDASGRVIGASKSARDITERKRIENALLDQTRDLELLNETGTAIAGDLDLQSIVQTVTDKTVQLTDAKFGAFFYNVENKDGESYSLFTLSGAPREAFERFGMPRNTPIFSPTFLGEGIVRSDDITQDPRYGKMGPHHGMPTGHLPVRSYLAVPVVSRNGQVIGGLFYGHPEVGVFTEQAERLVAGVAAQAAVAIDNARLYQDVRRAAEERAALLEAERAARNEAERTNLIKDEFLATLSHELRTPLNAILGWSELLRRGNMSQADIAEAIAVIDRNARAQTQLIADLLDMSRITSGKMRLDLQRVDLQAVVTSAIASIRQAADNKGVRLQVMLDPNAGPVRGDPSRLQQCVWNLVSNAIKFTPKTGKVQVSLQQVNSHIELVVNDTGEGVKPEFLPHIFERFRQADATTTRRHGGLGLGLSIVKNLVELHGGTIHAASSGEGQGSTFRIELPLMLMEHGAGKPPREHPRGHTLQPAAFDHPKLDGIRVLVVDDEIDGRELVRRVLEECGASVYLASSVREAMRIVQSEPLDMIVSDIGMPGEDGYEFIRRVRELDPNLARIPAAALTAFARAEDRTRALRAGYQIHVVKPVDPVELTAVIASQVRRS